MHPHTGIFPCQPSPGPIPGTRGNRMVAPGRPSYDGPMAPGGQLDGKVVLVSGGASDIGRATALRLAGAGAAVVVGDVSTDGAASVAEEVEGAGGRAIGVLCDVRREESVAAFVERAVAEFGTVDAVDHNAAWSHPRLDTDAVGVDLGVWERAIEITTRGALLLARHAIPVMTAGGGGSIVDHFVGDEHHRRVDQGGLRRGQGRR